MKLHLYVVQSCLVVFSLLKVIDGRKNVVKFANKTPIMLTSKRFVCIFSPSQRREAPLGEGY